VRPATSSSDVEFERAVGERDPAQHGHAALPGGVPFEQAKRRTSGVGRRLGDDADEIEIAGRGHTRRLRRDTHAEGGHQADDPCSGHRPPPSDSRAKNPPLA
jgi:hypothetical protein